MIFLYIYSTRIITELLIYFSITIIIQSIRRLSQTLCTRWVYHLKWKYKATLGILSGSSDLGNFWDDISTHMQTMYGIETD